MEDGRGGGNGNTKEMCFEVARDVTGSEVAGNGPYVTVQRGRWRSQWGVNDGPYVLLFDHTFWFCRLYGIITRNGEEQMVGDMCVGGVVKNFIEYVVIPIDG
ncbi:hypothetical protein L6452_06596 [Arctium lappa]|uniref:Uncharacterized protein n=1 Tax=Arctium lappa TaxID=4217 RepID=A0ACB9EIZ4_ARCLA|nr:hypothetical protein L6452_06596 [Arctium lappa]